MNKILDALELIGLLALLAWLFTGWAIAITINLLGYPSAIVSIIALWWLTSWLIFLTIVHALKDKGVKK